MIIQGDCVEVMKGFEANAIDAIVCDPPYELGFMGKAWDSSGVAYQTQTWEAALRVLKPGGHLLAFGGTRTYHRLTCAIEDAGFEIRDCIMWMYGSGFPKSKNVALSIDKGEGLGNRGHAIATASTQLPNGRFAEKKLPPGENLPRYESKTEKSKQWTGWGTALKPAHEPIVVARKPLIGTVAANVLAHGTGALNIDACRIGTSDQWEATGVRSDPSIALSGGADGSLNVSVSSTHKLGRWPANVALSHSPECQPIGQQQVKGRAINKFTDGAKPFGNGAGHDYESEQFPDELVDVFDCVPDCPVRMLDEQAGSVGSGWKTNYAERYAGEGRQYDGGSFGGGGFQAATYADSGGPSRFFYCAKTNRKERNAGLDGFDGSDRKTPMAGRGQAGLKCQKCGKWKNSGSPCQCTEPEFEQSTFERPASQNSHPTVKPIELMRWLVRLVTPPDGTVLDCFCGSGSTGCAAVIEGFNFIGIEREPEYVAISEARIAHWEKVAAEESQQESLFS